MSQQSNSNPCHCANTPAAADAIGENVAADLEALNFVIKRLCKTLKHHCDEISEIINGRGIDFHTATSVDPATRSAIQKRLARITSVRLMLSDVGEYFPGRRPPSINTTDLIKNIVSWELDPDKPQTLPPFLVAYLEASDRKTLPVPDRHRCDGASSSTVKTSTRRDAVSDNDFVSGRDFLDFSRGLI